MAEEKKIFINNFTDHACQYGLMCKKGSIQSAYS